MSGGEYGEEDSMRESADAPTGVLLEHDDTVVILCPWRHAGFLWAQLLTKRRLHYDRVFGDLAQLRDALERERNMAGASDVDRKDAEWDDRPPLKLRLPRGVAVIVAQCLSAARALPDGADGYDPESPMLYSAALVNQAREIGADWTRQLYLEPNPS
jgi:hypothetical protein